MHAAHQSEPEKTRKTGFPDSADTLKASEALSKTCAVTWVAKNSKVNKRAVFCILFTKAGLVKSFKYPVLLYQIKIIADSLKNYINSIKIRQLEIIFLE